MTSALLMIKEVVSSMNGCVLKKGTVSSFCRGGNRGRKHHNCRVQKPHVAVLMFMSFV